MAENERVRQEEIERATPEYKFKHATGSVLKYLEEAKVPRPTVKGDSLLDSGTMDPTPLLIRSDLDKIRKLVVQSSRFIVFIGSSGFGKSTGVQLALAGVSPISAPLPPAIFVSMRKSSNFWEDIARAFNVPYDKDTSSAFVLGVMETALIQRKKEGKAAPIIFFDDVHNVLMLERTTREVMQAASNLFTWLLELQISGLATIKLMSSKPHVVPALKKLSGFDRLAVERLPSVPELDVKNHLLEHTQLSKEEVVRAVDVFGAHMGDTSDLIATFLGKDRPFIEKHFEDCLDKIIRKSEEGMLQVLAGEAKNGLPRHDLVHGAHAVFRAFVESLGKPVDVVQVRKSSGLGYFQFKAIMKDLIDAKQLVDIDGRQLGLYAPRQRHTYLAVKDDPVVKDALAASSRGFFW